jgi:uncharacterized damage-inducible protein DinB
MMHQTCVAFALALAIGVTSVAAQAPATPRPPTTFTAYLKGQYATVKANLTGSADKMPAEHFGFRPSPDVMTYSELLGHLMNTQYGYCNAVKGGPSPAAGRDFMKTTDKAAMIQIVKDSFAYCDDAFAGLTEANALEMISVGVAPNQRQIGRANQLTQLVVHGNEHYGNLVTYMRIKGVVPPSSTPAPK